MFLIAHGKITKVGTGAYGDQTVLGTLADGDYFGETALIRDDGIWEFTAKAVTTCTVLTLPRNAFDDVLSRSETLQAHLDAFVAGGRLRAQRPRRSRDLPRLRPRRRADAAGHVRRLRSLAA